MEFDSFDDQRLDTFFLTLPIGWRGTLAQYARRVFTGSMTPSG